MRLIDANILLECLSRLEASGGHWLYRKACDEMIQGFFPKLINEQPTVDAVEVVRCKDCKYGILDEDDDIWKCVYSAEFSEENGEWFGFIDYNKADHFCSNGERRTDV